MRKPTTIAIALLSVSLIYACGSTDEAAKIDGPTESSSAATSATTQAPAATATQASPSPTPTPTPPPPSLERVSEAYSVTQNSFDSKYSHDWVVMLSNKTNQVANFVEVKALFFSEANILLGTSEDYAYVWPGQTSPAHGSESFAERAARMEIRVESKPRFQEVKTQAFPQVSDVQVVRDRFSSKITGKVTSPWTTDVEDMEVVCILKDAEGRLVGVEWSFLDLLPGGATAVVECSYISSDTAAKTVSAEMFLNLSSITKVVE